MKALVPISLLLILALSSCSRNHIEIAAFHDDPTITSLNGTWKVISFEDFVTNQVEFKTDQNSKGYDIIVTFDDTKDPKELSGKNTTNTIFGTFVYLNERQFNVIELGSTKIGQRRWADQFAKAILDDDTTFKINSKRLRIYYDNSLKSVTLAKQ